MNQRFYRLVLSGMLATGLALCSAAAFAQAPGGGMGRRGPMTPDEQLAQMTKRYNLSTDQQAKIKPLLESQQQQAESMRQDTSLSRDDRMAKMQSLRSDTETKVEAVLNDQQKQQYEQDRQRMQQRMMNRGGGGGGADQGGPPPQ
jgi:periplasmic protein CpxP/Spy